MTCGNKGIGRAIADVLADEGCNLLLAARNQPALDDTAPDPAAYIASAAGNAALMGCTRSLAHGSHNDGIRVVGINPGAIATEQQEMIARSRAEAQFGDAELWREIYKGNPFGRAGTPQEIANTVAFFASPKSSYTSGTILTIDGGRA